MLAEAAVAAAAATAAARRTALTIASWNVAAVNNNPFEYWLTMPDHPAYEKLMIDVESFLDRPEDGDVPVHEVFTDGMFDRLEKRMTETAGWTATTPAVRKLWEEDYRDRRIVSGFVRDKLLGSKRLASMPDRVTNTINAVGEDGKSTMVCRPTVINMYGGDLSTVDRWYDAWETFMFDTKLQIPTGAVGSDAGTTVPYKMLRPIKRSKYPDVTEEEEAASLPLQTVCGAIFDAILVHMMNTVSKSDVWQPLKKTTFADGLVRDKVDNTLGILEQRYANDVDVIALQEASLALVERARSGKLGELFHVVTPAGADPARDQNSVVLLKKETFPASEERGIQEITKVIDNKLGKDAPVVRGDILAVSTKDKGGIPYVVASFHGDTNGLATAPVLDALMETMSSDSSNKDGRLIFGLDANTYEKAKPGKQADVLEFGRHYASHSLTSCWGDVPQPTNYTTFNARTYLQPQLNKACRSEDKRKGGDINPKDFILFSKKDFEVMETWKDNTGKRRYEEGMAFPTLTFPSDHGIVATVLMPRRVEAEAETCSS